MEMKYDDDEINDDSEQSSQFDAIIGYNDIKKRITITHGGHSQSSSCTSSSYTTDSDFSCCSETLSLDLSSYNEVGTSKSRRRRQSEEGKSEHSGYLSRKNSANELEVSKTSTYDGDEWRQVARGNQVYYYNRRTRESVWELPDNARLVGKPVISTNAGLPKEGENEFEFQTQNGTSIDGARSVIREKCRRQDRDLLASDLENLSLSLSTIKRVDNEMSFDRPLPSRLPRTYSVDETNDSTATSQNMHGHVSEITDITQVDASASLQNNTHVDQWDEDIHVGPTEDSRSIGTKPQMCDQLTDRNMNIEREHLFCLYCGLRCSVDGLFPHLRQCSVFETMKNLDIHSKAEKAYLAAWSEESQNQSTPVSTPKKKNVEINSGMKQEIEATGNYVKRRPLSNRRDRSDSATSSFSSAGSVKIAAQSHLMSTCPFCSKVFLGKKLSGHLLSCKERKKIRERRESSRNTPKNEKKKKALLTAGGRQLPKFPALERKRSVKN